VAPKIFQIKCSIGTELIKHVINRSADGNRFDRIHTQDDKVVLERIGFARFAKNRRIDHAHDLGRERSILIDDFRQILESRIFVVTDFKQLSKTCGNDGK